ncbi:MAG TPA: glycosyltransferase family 2 protein [Acidisoma sp.]|uniref:glycosyltransferase family 2 protein n=1 Tax=Acidisoma sp. TaxID=1872115 RepID=UPI002BBD0964|nr:glycosyltransferase family 2 protein [Acidisoma sp.]HTI01965.1 glycosyltransferase family 2 protein [Acidisoma sp.]
MGRFLKLMSAHGLPVMAEEATGHITNGRMGLPGNVSVFAYHPDENARQLYLTACLPEGRVPALRPQETVGQFVPVNLSRTSSDSFCLYSPRSNLFAVAARPGHDDAAGHVLFSVKEPKGWERFTAAFCDQAVVPRSLAEAAPFLERFHAQPKSLAGIAALLAELPENALGRDILNAVGFVLPNQLLTALAEECQRQGWMRQRFAELYPDDLSASHGLPGLCDWIEQRMEQGSPTKASPFRGIALRHLIPTFGRREQSSEHRPDKPGNTPRIKKLGPEFDKLDDANGSFGSLPHACTMALRQITRPRQRACVIATARNEGRAIVEWVAHYKAVGFDEIFIYSNDNEDGSDALLRRLAQAGEIVWTDNVLNQGRRPQPKAYAHALQLDPHVLDYEWSLVVDLDEFLEFDWSIFGSLADYLDWCECLTLDAICFSWLVMGSNGETVWRDASMRQRFPFRRNLASAGCHVSPLVKSFFRTNRYVMSTPHSPISFLAKPRVVVTPSGELFSFDPARGRGQSLNPTIHMGWIAHYFFKSNEEFLRKFSRSRGDAALTTDLTFPSLTKHFLNAFLESTERVADIRPPGQFDLRLEAEVQRLRALPGVAQAERAIRAWYEQSHERMVEAAMSSSAIADAGDVGKTFMRPFSG